MDYAEYGLTPIDDMGDCPFPFFDEPQTSILSDEIYYKIYHDGGHYVATPITRSNRKTDRQQHTLEDIDILFDSLFTQATRLGLNNYTRRGKRRDTRDMTDYIRNGIIKLFPDYPNLDGYIEKKIERKYHNLGVRKKRFRRKAYLNRWNYFVTFTYDDKKHSPETFRKKLRKCLSNLHTRRGWRYMGVFENAPDTGRLHFHGVLYVPDGEMISRLTEKKDYSTAQGQMQITHSNNFFAESFGRNDFEEVTDMAMQQGRTVEYILKYIEKQGERIVYSRGIASEICKKISGRDIITAFTDYVVKYVLFDDVISWEKDIMHYKPRQMTLIDLWCNPQLAA